MTFGEALREIRQNKGVYLKNVAEFMGWSVVYISDIERGHRNPPSRKDIIKLSEFFNVDGRRSFKFS